MTTTDFSTTLVVAQTPEEAFNAIINVRGWWSATIEGNTSKLNDEFIYRYKDLHYSKQRLVELVPNKRVVWEVLDSSLNFVKEKEEWNGTKIIFEIARNNNRTEVHFTHEGLVPEIECFDACCGGWTYYLQSSLLPLITKGKGKPNLKVDQEPLTTQQVAERFSELARQEKWFDIQDELFADDVKSIDPPNSPYFGYAEGKATVRKKGEEWVKRIEEFHGAYTTQPIVGGNHFAVGRGVDITVQGFGRIKLDEIMLYEVKDGEIVSEQFFY